jgi:hypothetical protein
MVTGIFAISVGVAVGEISVDVGAGSNVGVLVNSGDGSDVPLESTCCEELQAVKIIIINENIRYVLFMCYILTGFSY